MSHINEEKNVKNSESPLEWTDTSGNTYNYYAKPMTMAAIYILVQEMCERLAYYGIVPNLQSFTKIYLGLSDADADSYVSIFQGVVMVTPLLSAIIADTWWGVYRTIFIFSLVYMAGLVLLAMSSIESISEHWMVHLSLMGLIALGTGGIKSCVNVFGAQQFHPVEHKKKITSFFTYFYAVINAGALVGGIIVPILQEDVSYFAGFCVPLGAFVIATTVFMMGTPRYVRMFPQGSVVLEIIKVTWNSICNGFNLEKCKKSNGGKFEDNFIEDARCLFSLVPIFTLIVPFIVAYSQMTTAFLSQGKKMDTNLFGYDMAPALMQNVDPISVMVCSVLVEGSLYPYLRKIGKMPSVMSRFMIGCLFGAASLLYAYFMELIVMAEDPLSISIWWQIPQFFFIAAGEIFLVSTSYEVAFTQSPDSLKAVASAINLVFFAVASFIAAALFQICKPWLPDHSDDGVTPPGSHYDYYYLVLMGICILGAIGSYCMRGYYSRIEKKESVEPPHCVSRRDLPHRQRKSVDTLPTQYADDLPTEA